MVTSIDLFSAEPKFKSQNMKYSRDLYLVIFPCERDCYIYENFVLVMFLIGSEEFSILDWLEKSLYHKEKLPNESPPVLYVTLKRPQGLPTNDQ